MGLLRLARHLSLARQRGGSYWDQLRANLSAITPNLEQMYASGRGVQELWDFFKRNLKASVDRHNASKTCRGIKFLPWKDCRREIRKAEWDHINNTIQTSLDNKDTKPFWRYIKSRRRGNVGVSPLKEVGKLHCDGKSITGDNYPNIRGIIVDETGVKKLLTNINPSKACGPDGIPNMVLMCADNLSPMFTRIFQRSLDTGLLPSDWRRANISSIYKKGDKHLAENYRPVSLTSVCLHMNYLPDVVRSQVRLFAEDCLLYRTIKTFQDHITLQQDLENLEHWALRWGMKFNARRCYIIRGREKSQYLYFLDNVALKQVQSSPYLGLLLSEDLMWGKHIDSIVKKASSTLGFLRRNLRHCTENSRRTAYLALVRPILEYGASVWDPHVRSDIDHLERIQKQAARFITQDYKSREPGCITKMLNRLCIPTLRNAVRRSA
ncbi:uncharacterized protein LOC141904816 [Tubulanus polymorphus]|uniref:uncharacterized protein LOC141904816 n=1 Tax=Tubulanus polymorphus TaxID=672921 RepID=UPI003DA377E4